MDTRVTGWLGYGLYGYPRYRIWKRCNGGAWQQRHEWERENGKKERGQWIASAPAFFPDMVDGDREDG